MPPTSKLEPETNHVELRTIDNTHNIEVIMYAGYVDEVEHEELEVE